MFCEKCGKERIDDARFCENCGTPFDVEETHSDPVLDPIAVPPADPQSNLISDQTADSQENLISDPKIKTAKPLGEPEPDKLKVEKVLKPETSEKKRDLKNEKKLEPVDDGEEWQWIYEFSFWRNPAILITTAKVLLLALLVPALLLFLITLGDGLDEALQVGGSLFGYGLLVMAGLLALAYPLVGMIYGGKYLVLFKIDGKGVNHIQLHNQVRKAEAMGFLTALAGLAGGNLSASGAGLMAATRHNLYTTFKKVKSVKAVRSRNTIYLNEALTKNQVYPEKGQFDLVLEHIIKQCPKNVKISGR